MPTSIEAMFSRAASRAIGKGMDYGIAKVERVVISRKFKYGAAGVAFVTTYLIQERVRRIRRIEKKLDIVLEEVE